MQLRSRQCKDGAIHDQNHAQHHVDGREIASMIEASAYSSVTVRKKLNTCNSRLSELCCRCLAVAGIRLLCWYHGTIMQVLGNRGVKVSGSLAFHSLLGRADKFSACQADKCKLVKIRRRHYYSAGRCDGSYANKVLVSRTILDLWPLPNPLFPIHTSPQHCQFSCSSWLNVYRSCLHIKSLLVSTFLAVVARRKRPS